MEDPYSTEAYKDIPHAQDRFLSLTYLSGNSKQLIMKQQQRHNQKLGMNRGTSLGNIISEVTEENVSHQRPHLQSQSPSKVQQQQLQFVKSATTPSFATASLMISGRDERSSLDHSATATKDKSCGKDDDGLNLL